MTASDLQKQGNQGMYIPAQHRVTDRHELIQFIRTHSFATLITSGSDSEAPPEATHLPLLLI